MHLIIHFTVADWLFIAMELWYIRQHFGPDEKSFKRLSSCSRKLAQGRLLWYICRLKKPTEWVVICSQTVFETLGVITAEDFIKESACLHFSICIFMQLCNWWQEISCVIFCYCCLPAFPWNALKDLNEEAEIVCLCMFRGVYVCVSGVGR